MKKKGRETDRNMDRLTASERERQTEGQKEKDRS